MNNRISLKISDNNAWIIESLKKEQLRQTRPSLNNMIETIMVEYLLNLGHTGKSVKVESNSNNLK